MNDDYKIRVLVAGVEPSGRKRGVQVMASALRDAGMEVVYAGNCTAPLQVATAVVQEDVRAVGIWLPDRSNWPTIKKMVTAIDKQGVRDMVFIVYGDMADKDIIDFKKMGTHMMFIRESGYDKMVAFILSNSCP